jgi:DNA repair protein RadD
MDHGLMIEPTGSGKSIILAGIIDRLKQPTLVFQPSKEILDQNYTKLVSYGYQPKVYSASAGRKETGGDITLATIGSVVNKPELFRHMKYVLVDECDMVNAKNAGSMFMKFFSQLPDIRIIGLTATPYRLVTDGFGGSILKFLTRTRPRVFKHVVHITQNGELFQKGYLAKLEYKEVKTGFDEGRLRLNSTGADYTDESVRRHFKELNFSDKIVRCINRLGELNRRGALVFTRFVEEAEYVASKVPGAAIVSAKTPPQEREQIIAGFRSGKIPVVTNVGVLSIGFDYPELANVILARPTMSLRLYYQQVGRGVRPHPNKKETFIIDMVGLVKKFGRVENLHVHEEQAGTGKWIVTGDPGQLTNIYYGEKGQPQ